MLQMLLLLPFLFPLLCRGAAAPGFLPLPIQDGFQDVANIFRKFSDLMENTQGETGKELNGFENPLDFNQLPPNYHNEEQEEHQVGNNTIYSHRKIDKVTNNETGDMVISQKTVASIKQGYRGDAEPWKARQQSESQEREEREAPLSQSSSGLRAPFQSFRQIFWPRLAFLFIHFSTKTTPAKQANPIWLAGPRFPSWLQRAVDRPKLYMVSFSEQFKDVQPLPLPHRRRKHRHHMRRPHIVYILKKL